MPSLAIHPTGDYPSSTIKLVIFDCDGVLVDDVTRAISGGTFDRRTGAVKLP